MSDSLKILLSSVAGNSGTADWGSIASVYPVPDRTQGSITSVSICNTTASGVTIDIAVLDDKNELDAVTVKHYVFKTLAVSANTTKLISPGITLDERNVLAFNCSASSGVAINVFGVEISK